jgi:hypothetical protein
MADNERNITVLFIGIQATLLAVFLLVLTQSLAVFSRTAEFYIGLSILLAGGGTALIAREVNR